MAATNRNNPKRAKASESTYSVIEFERDFPDDATCLDWLWRRLYSTNGTHAECPKCGEVRKFHRVVSRPSYSCDVCGHHIHPTAGTIFHKSPTALHLWFRAIFLMSSTRCGISAKHLEREIGVTYKTAWRMFHRIRELLMGDDGGPFDGTVEIDETYVGGKRRGRSGRPNPTETKKSPVLGMVQRGSDGKPGRVYAVKVPDVKAVSLLPRVESRVLPSSMIYTDELHSYKGLGSRGYFHSRINHSQGVYVMGDVHTNSIEGFWNLVKNGIRGSHHMVSAKYLQSYLDEYCYRYNHRHDATPMFLGLLHRIEKYPSVA